MSFPSMYDHYPLISAPSLSMSELVCKTFDEYSTSAVIGKWLKTRHAMYQDWFKSLRDRQAGSQWQEGQMLAWNKGDFAPENIFCRTVDTCRVLPFVRSWTTNVYYHKTMLRPAHKSAAVLLTLVQDILFLRAMHEHGCDDVWIIITQLTEMELDNITDYFKLVCQLKEEACDPDLESKIRNEHARINTMIRTNNRLPCFTQLDLTFRGILKEKAPPFIIIFSHEGTTHSQVIFTNEAYVPAESIFHDLPTGCFDPNCKDNCEMLRFPRKGLESAVVIPSGKPFWRMEMCNWVECESIFSFNGVPLDSKCTAFARPKKCSKCRLVSYCSAEHQKLDWEEHKRICVRLD